MARSRSRSLHSHGRGRRRRSESSSKSRRRSRARHQRRSRSKRRSPTPIQAACQSTAALITKHAPEVPEDVRDRAAAKLVEAGYASDWQVLVLPREVLLHVFPPASHGVELTAVLHVQRKALPSLSGGEVIVSQGKARHRRTHDREDASSCDSGDGIGFDAAECLKKYRLHSIDHGHLIPFDSLNRIVQTAGEQRRRKRVQSWTL